MLAATHTHSGPGGYTQYFTYLITTGGFVFDNFQVIFRGILGEITYSSIVIYLTFKYLNVESIDKAHNSMIPGRLLYNKGFVIGASANRFLIFMT